MIEAMVQRDLKIQQSDTGIINIAFATDNQTHVNQHLGSCRTLSIYGLSPDKAELQQVVEFTAVQGHNQQKIAARIKVLKDCFAVYCLACGDPVRKQLMANGIRVIKLEAPDHISQQIQQIQANWPGNIAFRQQRKQQSSEQRFTELGDSDWQADEDE